MMHMRKVMKTIGICSMAAIMMAGLSGCGGKTGGAVSSGAKNAAKIGFTAALTGGAAAYGKSEEEGVRLAVEEINKKGDFPIDLLVEDTKAVPADSMNATKKLIQEKVSLIIGPMTSNEAKAAGPIIQNAKVPSLEIRHGGKHHGYRGLHFQKFRAGVEEYPADGEEDAQALGLQDRSDPLCP